MQSVKPSNRLSALSAQSEGFGRGAHQIVVMDSLCVAHGPTQLG